MSSTMTLALFCVPLSLVVGCVVEDPGADGTADAGTTDSTMAESSTSSGSSPPPDPTGADSTETGDPLDCDALAGNLTWSEQADAPSPTGIALDPLSDTGEFYLSYRIGGCLSRHDSDGQEQWSVDGMACERIAVDSAGDVLLAGEDITVGLGHARISKVGPDGMEQWTHVHTTKALSSIAQDLATDPEDNVLVIGKDVDVDDVDWVTKLDAGGDPQWLVPLEGAAIDSERSRIGVDAAGDIRAAHTVRDPAGNNLVRLVRLDPDGMLQWSLDLPGEEIRLESMGVDSMGRTLLALYTYDFDEAGATRFLVFVDGDGNELWTRTSEDTAIEFTTVIAFAPCDTIVVAGMGDPGPSTLGRERQIWISKLSIDGEPLWAQMIDGPFEEGDADDQIHDIAVDAQGRVTAAGTMTVDTFDNGKFPGYVRDRWLGQFDQ